MAGKRGARGAGAEDLVDVADLQERYPHARRAARAARHVLVRERRPRARLSLALVDDRRIARLHVEFLGVAGPTDVVSFPLGDEDDDVLGEVVVSTDTAAREARARGLELEEEVLRYVVHGTLHLLGYDDHAPKDRAKMHRRQEALLGEILGREPLGGERFAERSPRAKRSR